MTASRAYLDWNATTPLRPEARAAMAAAMEMTGNPSSVHAEGRAARACVERARERVAAAFGAEPGQVVFTSGATEAAAMALSGRDLVAAPIEHDCVAAWTRPELAVGADGLVAVADPGGAALQAANPETGVLQNLPPGIAVVDGAQAAGKIPFDFAGTGAGMALISAHKFGGPKGVGALFVRDGVEAARVLRGGGQETGRRAGTEAIVAIAGFAAAAEAAARDLADGEWDRVRNIRDILESALASAAEATIFVGKDSARRLPNVTCLATPGWKGEMQVMAMDLAGFAVSAGSACSSGRVKGSRTLGAMGLPPEAASGAIRVSIGPATTEAEVLAFAEAWDRARRRHRDKAATAA
ncbi:aminotransferase class V-fold PLP-dependent enzyme [Amaricoccus sp.]|uniref:cysteine desulfurase family protein n=1 Tax=Amaricoccus sp. TaxID=1872485 RepID=UPI001B74F3A4|nr:aminotransferase class V-fold PLP-dependent enzyme [Amaricoccus sp.]MBP7242506.1 aminotransferase class V-fold PLP-dependent enzyme [Amaricoccus sp.]